MGQSLFELKVMVPFTWQASMKLTKVIAFIRKAIQMSLNLLNICKDFN